MRLAAMILVMMSLLVQYGRAQDLIEPNDSLSSYLQFEDSSPLSCLFTFFPPFFIQHGIEMKEFLSSTTFRAIRKRYGDRRAVDAIYIRAMQLTNNNTAIALLLAAIATFDHRVVGLRMPVVRLFFPLSNESDEEFARRLANLPKAIYEDSPKGKFGDRDKLQHFFGSTFLTVIFESRQPATRIGDFIEQGEDAFIIDGAIDDRDLRANRQGQKFGLALLEDNRRLPSDFLTFKSASKKLSNTDAHCSGGW